MQYFGGKSRIAKTIAAHINANRKFDTFVWDPFCGGLSVAAAIADHAPVLATDLCQPLISMYQSIQSGWDPPSEVTREEYEAAKSLPDTHPLKAFCGFACSFGGLWFHSYSLPTRSAEVKSGPEIGKVKHMRRHAGARAGLLKEVPKISAFDCVDFLAVEPSDIGACLYLDPPYRGCYPYEAVPEFDYPRFLVAVRSWSKYCDIFVSEYDFPDGRVIWQKPTRAGFGAKNGSTEKLFYLPRQHPAHTGRQQESKHTNEQASSKQHRPR
jgi:DNA adenine methylase